jgi:hypothetical protein
MEIFHVRGGYTGLKGLPVFNQGSGHVEGNLMTPAALLPTVLAGMMIGVVNLGLIRAGFIHGPISF